MSLHGCGSDPLESIKDTDSMDMQLVIAFSICFLYHCDKVDRHARELRCLGQDGKFTTKALQDAWG